MYHWNSKPGIGKYGHSKYGLARTLPWGGSELSFFADASPAVADGDFFAYPPLSSPGNFPSTISPTGVPVITAGGSTARQALTLDVYDMTFRKWMGIVTDYVNDKAPTLLDPTSYQIQYVKDIAIDDIDLSIYWSDPEADNFDVTTLDTLPPGLTLAGNVLTGTPTTAGTYSVTFTATDFLGQATNAAQWTFTVISNQLVHVERGQRGWFRGAFTGV